MSDSTKKSITNDTSIDVVRTFTNFNIMTGTRYNDTLNGTSGNDKIYGDDGNDVINGNTGNDLIYGGSGSDSLSGNDGNDTLDGGSGNDALYGGAGNDVIVAGDGDDVLCGGKGDDTLDGISGKNTFVFQAGDGHDTITNSKSSDTILFSHQTNIRFSQDMSTKDLILKYAGSDTITLKDYFTKGHSVKTIKNGSLVTTLKDALNKYGMDVTGTSGNDTIKGTDGNDIIMAGDGNDIISGGKGNDVLNGGNGDDTYYLNTGDGNDVIYNNNHGKDNIIFTSQQALTYSRTTGSNDLVISYGNNDSVRLIDYFTQLGHTVKGIKNGASASVKNLAADINSQGLTLTGSNGNDMYETSLDRHYTVKDQGGTDTIRITKDVNLGNRLYVLFNVESTYTLADGINFGDVCLVSNNQLSEWTTGGNFKGVVIENNAVENILVGGRQMTSSDVAQIAADVAGWLNTNGFASVQDVLDTGNTTNINALIAEFQSNTTWTPIQ